MLIEHLTHRLRERDAQALRRRRRVLGSPCGPQALTLEGAARRGVQAGPEGRIRTVHAAGAGDDAIVDEVVRQLAFGDGRDVTVVTADRQLRERIEAVGARTNGPKWLLIQL